MGINVGAQESFDLKVVVYYKEQLPEELTYLNKVFTGETGEIFTHICNEDGGKYTLLVGFGKEEELTLEKARNTMAKVAKKAKELKSQKVALTLPEVTKLPEEELVRASVQGLQLGLYTFEKYKTATQEELNMEFYLQGLKNEDKAHEIVAETLNEVAGICLARDLINEPSNVLVPETLANIAKEVGARDGFEVEVLDEKALEELGLKALLTVGKGSVNPPRLIIMRHMHGGDEEVLGLVGKGLTCDTGGYSLKSSDSMYYMKTDMSGAANVLGTMSILAKNKVQKNVIAVIPTCENVVSGNSYKVGDVLDTMAGKTVEVLNTDAEGRLALADALYYITEKEKVDKIIDLATLTGVVGTTFGNIYTGTISNNDEFYAKFQVAADKAAEKFWRLPTGQEYRDMINSDVADIKNTGGAGTITAAMFLKEFIQDRPWIHLDIAATACTNPGRFEYEYKGGTGVAIRTIYELIKN